MIKTRKETASKLRKIACNSKQPCAAAALVLFFVLYGPACSQNFPSDGRPGIGVEYEFRAAGAAAQVSPRLSVATTLEFRQIYAFRLALEGSYVRTGEDVIPLVGGAYDLHFKLYRSDPPASLTPILAAGLAKQWSVRQAGEESKKLILDLEQWRVRAFAGLDLGIFRSSHLKIMAGASWMLGAPEFYDGYTAFCAAVHFEL